MSTVEHIADFIGRTVEDYGYDGVLIGISGGIDSAVAAALCVRALGADRVRGLTLLERDSAPETGKDARTVCKHLQIEHEQRDISPVLRKMGVYALVPSPWFAPRGMQERYTRKRWEEESESPYLDDLYMRGDDEFLRGAAFYRAKHRARMAILYMEAERRRYAVCGATNKSEIRTGFYVKYGDDAADIEPLANLYKTQVRELAEALNLPTPIRTKTPSPDLIPGLHDEKVLGIQYPELDRILQKLDNGEAVADEGPKTVAAIRNVVTAAQRRAARALSPPRSQA